MSLVISSEKSSNQNFRTPTIPLTVAVGQDATSNIAVSTNGTSWTKLPVLFGATSISKIAWNGYRYIAVGVKGTNTSAYTSTNGYNWIEIRDSTVTTNASTNCIAVNKKLWLMGSSSTNKILYSQDGIEWDLCGIVASVGSVNCFCWIGSDNPFWLAGTNTNQSMIFSFDGKVWGGLGANAPIGTGATCNAIVWDGISRIVAGMGNGTLYTSVLNSAGNFPGISSWTLSATPFTITYAICFNGSIWVAGGSGGAILAYSYNGTTWTNVATPNLTTSCRSITWNGNLFIAVGEGATNIATSRNGVIWTSSITGGTSGTQLFSTSGFGIASFNFSDPIIRNGISNAGNITSMVLDKKNSFQQSGNLISQSSSNGYNFLKVDNNYGTFFKCPYTFLGSNGDEGIFYEYSFDGITNYVAVTPTPANLIYPFSFIHTNNIYLMGLGQAAGPIGDTLAYSYDGINWTGLGQPVDSPVRTIEYNGRMFIAGGGGATPVNNLAYSYDGINWTGLGTTFFTNRCRFIRWNGKMWLGGGNDGLLYSFDGFNWVNTGVPIAIYGIEWNGTMWIAVGLSDSAYYSYDGISWVAVFVANGASTIVDVAWNGTIWVLFCNPNIFYSYTGLSWTSAGLSLINFNKGIFNGTYFIGATSNLLYYSSNGINWSVGPTSATANITSIYGGRYIFHQEPNDSLIEAEPGSGLVSNGNSIGILSGKTIMLSPEKTGLVVYPPSIDSQVATVYSNASTLKVLGAPTAGINSTITNSYGLDVQRNSIFRSAIDVANDSIFRSAIDVANASIFRSTVSITNQSFIQLVGTNNTQSITSNVDAQFTAWNNTPVVSRGGMSYGSGRVTVPTAGVYMVTASIEWRLPAVDAGNRATYIRKGSTGVSGIVYTLTPGSSISPIIQNVSSLVDMAAGESVGIMVFQDSGSSQLAAARTSILFSVLKMT